MTFYLNDYEVKRAAATADRLRPCPLKSAVETLNNLVEWTNNNSDGWAYWPKPSRASTKLQQIVFKAISWNGTVTESVPTAAEVKAAYTPIKAFLTRSIRAGLYVTPGIVVEVPNG